MQDHVESTTDTAAALLGHLVDLESRLHDLPRQSPDLPSLEIWRQTETLLTDYILTTVKLVQLEPLALFAGLPRRTPFPVLDLDEFSEGTRQALYAAVVATHWNAPREHPEDYVPTYEPDEADLQVVFLHGRWFAFWRLLDEPEDAPISQRFEILRIEADPRSPYGVSFTGV